MFRRVDRDLNTRRFVLGIHAAGFDCNGRVSVIKCTVVRSCGFWKATEKESQ